MKPCPRVGQEAGRRAEIVRAVKKILESEGFKVECGETLKDIDCIFRKSYRLFEFRGGVIVVCGKIRAGEVGYAAALKNGLALDKMVMVARDEVDPEAKIMAGNYGIALHTFQELIEKEGLVSESRTYHIPFRVKREEADRIALGLRGIFMRRGEYLGPIFAYMPVYSVIATLTRNPGGTSSLLESEKVEFDVDLSSGSIVGVSHDGSLHLPGGLRRLFLELTLTHAGLLKIIVEEGGISFSNLAERIGVTVGELEKEISVLIDAGLVEVVRGDILLAKHIKLGNLRGILEYYGNLAIEDGPRGDNFITLPINVDEEVVDEFIEVYGVVESEAIVYYPLIIAAYKRKKGSRPAYSFVVIDGVSGKRLEDVEEALSTAGVSRLLEEKAESLARQV